MTYTLTAQPNIIVRDEVNRLAHDVAKNGIITKATERLIVQIVEVCAEHEKKNLFEIVSKCAAIARSEDDGAGTEADNRARRIADRIDAIGAEL